jgi:hypothetical protein
MAAADLNFLSWLRRGFAVGMPDAGPTDGPTQITVAVKTNAEPTPVQVSLPIVGPGDIAGIDARIVVKVAPGRDESDAEFDQFPAIELDQPDLPWRYTPISSPQVGAGVEHLPPWLVLIVLEDGEIQARVAPTADQKLAQVTVTSANILPDLAESWAWAHVQTTGAPDLGSVTTALGGAPGKVIARIFCPQRLKPQTAYNAFLVPAFERGRRAGLGLPLGPSTPPDPNDPAATVLALTPAWDASTSGSVTMPVYYEWRFLTGVVGSFDDLVRRVKPARLPDNVGRRRLDVSVPGYALPSAVPPPAPPPNPPPPPDTALLVEGALQSIPASQLIPSSVNPAFVTALRNFLASGQLAPAGNAKVVVPPVYGQWPAAITGLGTPPAPLPANPPWVSQLNTDPRNRVAGGLGTAVVQSNQEALMAGAWEQVGNLRSVNDERKITQAGREVFTRVFNRHALRGRIESILGLTAHVFGQLHAATGTLTVHAQVSAGKAGRDLLDPQWRRLSAPRGAIGRRLGFLTSPPTGQGAIELMNGTFRPAPEPRTPAGLVLSGDAFRSLVPGELTPTRITTLIGRGSDQLLFWGILFFCVGRKLLIGPPTPTWSWWWLLRMVRFGLELIRLAAGRAATDFRVALRDRALTPGLISGLPKVPGFGATDDVPSPLPAIPTTGATDSTDSTRFRTGLTDWLNDLAIARLPLPNPPSLDLTALRNLLSQKLHPGVTLIASLVKRITLAPDVTAPADALEELVIGPKLPQAMWTPLRDRSQEWIVPGLSQVATDTLGLLVPNQRFIEAYMVGLNHEMARELLWNEYPSDQRATVFRQFWDTAGYVKTQAEANANPQPDPDVFAEGFRDIKEIHKWKTTGLGFNSARRRDPANTLVVLLRAELVHRFPNVVVYAVPAPTGFPHPDVTGEIFPVFSGRLGLDSAYYGFELSVSDARGTSPLWYIVLQEQPAEPRFHIPVDVALPDGQRYLHPTDIATVPATAASFAFETYRTPIRVAVPAASMVPES